MYLASNKCALPSLLLGEQLQKVLGGNIAYAAAPDST